ncbi:MAG: TetR family transcriptional regulator [Microbacterium sp.]
MPPAAPQTPSRRSAARAGGERRNVRGDATRLRILRAAERLFADQGIAAAPLRDIGVAAGQRNHAAVQYHFGDRDRLVREILEARGAESEAARADLVAGLAAGGAPATVEDVVSAFIWPLAIHLQADNHYLAFLSRLIIEVGGYEGLSGADVHTGASTFTLRTLLGRLVPSLPGEVLDERWSVAETSAVHALARYQAAQRVRHATPARIEVLIPDLVRFLAAGIVAPLADDDPRAVASG